ncbi:DUF2293 domain-containing protein [Starkeya koreensis]|uniref:DUF2293 domain-containing protein n=1 Tax=Ancylobacter koreensis TaxID=266121 RepID=A0ABT0DS20_9HYPH|nr:DUF2293 domain-containing protein [Ancylobacter koreensis]MCK0210071.1 DUF2293 domain-containing protein [Ancylobacter koreensis]
MTSDDTTTAAAVQEPASPPHPRRGKSQWFFRIDPSPEERARFLDQLGIYLTAMYPGCPPQWRLELIKRARKGGHYGRLGEIAGVLATSSIRHRATDYERLLRVNGGREGLTREEARQVVNAEVADSVAEWRHGSPEEDEGFVAVRKQFRKAWRKGRKKPRPVLTANENAALAEYLKGWLERREQERTERPREAAD